MKTTFLLVVLALTPREETEPTLKRVAAGMYSARNPKPYPVVMMIDCGPDFEPVTLKLPANSREAVELKVLGTGETPTCTRQGWVRTKG